MTTDGRDADDLDGHTMEELGDYLDRGRTPADPSIEGSAVCRLALANMARVRGLALSSLDRESRREPERDDLWITGVLETIRSELTSGRDIPVAHPDPALRLAITEAAVRGLIRRSGDTLGGVVMGRCTLDGDVTTPGEPIRIDVTASIEYGLPAEETAERLRARIREALSLHTELNVVGIDVTFDDLHVGGRPAS